MSGCSCRSALLSGGPLTAAAVTRLRFAPLQFAHSRASQQELPRYLREAAVPYLLPAQLQHIQHAPRIPGALAVQCLYSVPQPEPLYGARPRPGVRKTQGDRDRGGGGGGVGGGGCGCGCGGGFALRGFEAADRGQGGGLCSAGVGVGVEGMVEVCYDAPLQ
eukprot:CAMPEP_0173263668 /NCGR_PEP_ID=MMETSP1142-20121109/27514_1 /TAXON_ID=483371 /ORGANISM="non described non described, Strain CCMP2298" /LENGTH=161 /DNA_ID=CAMNT_0014199055 /DNA_START=288 /DNA_END=774 /DNA_ORIENTATION=-